MGGCVFVGNLLKPYVFCRYAATIEHFRTWSYRSMCRCILYKYRKSHRGMFQRQNTTPLSQFCFIFFTWFLVECFPFLVWYSHTKPAQSPIDSRKKKIVSGSRFFFSRQFVVRKYTNNRHWLNDGNRSHMPMDLSRWKTKSFAHSLVSFGFLFLFQIYLACAAYDNNSGSKYGRNGTTNYARESCRWWRQQQ